MPGQIIDKGQSGFPLGLGMEAHDCWEASGYRNKIGVLFREILGERGMDIG